VKRATGLIIITAACLATFLAVRGTQDVIFVIIALFLLALFLYRGEISHTGNILHKRILAPVINENKRTHRSLTRKIETMEKRMNSTEQALEKFAAAIEIYAQHLSSHTSAIQGLGEASQELKRSAAEQNRVLRHLTETMGQPETYKEETAPKAEPEKPPETGKPIPVQKPFPPGCVRNRLTARTEKPGKV
jgi:uncharacterized membrane-anchored protein YhcB (DUF1043 family)